MKARRESPITIKRVTSATMIGLALALSGCSQQPEASKGQGESGSNRVESPGNTGRVPQPPRRRANIDQAVPLQEAVDDFNRQYPDPSPLTVEEVIAALRRIRDADPAIHPWFYEQYQRVAEERKLLPGFYFSHMSGLRSGDWRYKVDWKDLTFEVLPAHQPPTNFSFSCYNYRIRARFISSEPVEGRAAAPPPAARAEQSN